MDAIVWSGLLKLLQILPRRIMHVPVPDNIYLNMLTCWKQEMRSVLERCCKMTQSQKKQGSSARTPLQTPSQLWAENIHGIDGSYKTQQMCSSTQTPGLSLSFSFTNATCYQFQGAWDSTGNSYFLHTVLQIKGIKPNLTFLDSNGNYSSQ